MTLLMEYKQQRERSESQAIAQIDTIAAWMTLHSWACANEDPKELPMHPYRRMLMDEFNWGDTVDHDSVIDQLTDLVNDDPLHVQVRSGWENLGDTLEPSEFNILLCTGGPAVRIVGDIVQGCPERCRLQHQDWGTPWTEVIDLTDEQRAAVQWYAEQFYYGEC